MTWLYSLAGSVFADSVIRINTEIFVAVLSACLLAGIGIVGWSLRNLLETTRLLSEMRTTQEDHDRRIQTLESWHERTRQIAKDR